METTFQLCPIFRRKQIFRRAELMNCTELATELNQKPDTVYRRLKREFPGRTFALSTELHPDEIGKIRAAYSSVPDSVNTERRAERKIKNYFREMEAVEQTEAVADMAAEKGSSDAENPPELPGMEIDELVATNFLFIAAGIFSMTMSLGPLGFFLSLPMAAFPLWTVRKAGDLTKGDSFGLAFWVSVVVEIFWAFFHNQNIATALEGARFIPFGVERFAPALSIFICLASAASLQIRRKAAKEASLVAAGISVC